MAHNPSDLEAAPVNDPGGPDLGTDPKQIYRNLGIEISSLPLTAKCDRVRDFLCRNANVCVHMEELAEEIKYVSSRTLTFAPARVLRRLVHGFGRAWHQTGLATAHQSSGRFRVSQ
jgi:hypothetical protein